MGQEILYCSAVHRPAHTQREWAQIADAIRTSVKRMVAVFDRVASVAKQRMRDRRCRVPRADTR